MRRRRVFTQPGGGAAALARVRAAPHDARLCMAALTLLDYGIGNLRSLEKAFAHVGVDVHRTDDPADVTAATRLVVPGVGAFGACAEALRSRGLVEPIREAVDRGIPLLGVCVGMQLLFEASDENGAHAGLGLLPGRVTRFADGLTDDDGRRLKVPHMGWSPLTLAAASPVLADLHTGDHVYFVHSYRAVADRDTDVLAWADYGGRFPAVVGRGRVYGAQFHPEKSQGAGLALLRAFATGPV